MKNDDAIDIFYIVFLSTLVLLGSFGIYRAFSYSPPISKPQNPLIGKVVEIQCGTETSLRLLRFNGETTHTLLVGDNGYLPKNQCVIVGTEL